MIEFAKTLYPSLEQCLPSRVVALRWCGQMLRWCGDRHALKLCALELEDARHQAFLVNIDS